MSARKQRLYHRLQLAAHRVQKVADRALLESSGLTTAQAAVLSVLSEEGPVAQRIVARQLGTNESATTSMVRRLLRMRLVKRRTSAADARAWQLELTVAGRAALDRCRTSFSRVNRTLDAALRSDEIERLAACLARISAAFDESP